MRVASKRAQRTEGLDRQRGDPRRLDFDVILTAALGMLPPMLQRIHVDGDFISPAYVRVVRGIDG